MATFFGFEITRKKEEFRESVIPPDSTDGAALIDAGLGGYYSTSIDLDASIKSEFDLIRRYRQASLYSDVDSAIDEIINEMIISDDGNSAVEINLDNVKVSDSIKTKITEEFDNVLRLLDFSRMGYDFARDWYIDGRLFFYIVLSENVKDGIQELRYIDSRKIKKIKNYKKNKNKSGVDVITDIEEFFVYNDKGVSDTSSAGIKLKADSVIYANSGFMDKGTGIMLSFLHKSLKLVNQLKYTEDSLVIYRISRAPERRIFYIDVNGLNKMRSEQHIAEQMAKYKNKITYDAGTGEIKDAARHMSMMEDIWMPRRDKQTTEITTLPGGQNLGSIEDIVFFQNKLYKSLNVPISRLQQNQGMFDFGNTGAISRDEVKFAKFVDRLRTKFSTIFTEALKVQLVSKGIISIEDWDDIALDMKFDFQKDNLYSELKEIEILNNRLSALERADPFVGKYFDQQTIRKEILRQTDEEIAEIDKTNAKLLAQMEKQVKLQQMLAQQQEEEQNGNDQEFN